MIFNIKKYSSFLIGEYPYEMEVELFVPNKVNHKEPIILIPGSAHSTKCYKFDLKRKVGWANFLLSKGYRIYLVDWPGVGNSPNVVENDFINQTGEGIVKSLFELVRKLEILNSKVIFFCHSMSAPFVFKLEEKTQNRISKIIAIAPGPVGNIQENNKKLSLPLKESLITKKDDALKFWANAEKFPRSFFEKYTKLLQKTSPNLINERMNFNNQQLKINPNKIKSEIFIVTGDQDTRHPYEEDKKLDDFFRKYRIKSKFIWLPDKKILGNGHMMMIEENQQEIIKKIYDLCLK